MTDDALLSTPARSTATESSGWQDSRMDDHQGRLPQGRTGQGAGEAPWLATGGHPVGANPYSPPLQQAAGHYGAGYGDRTTDFGSDEAGARRWPQDRPGHDEHHHYQRFRADHERQLDEDYAAYRQHRFRSDFESWRQGRQDTIAPEHEGAVRSFGRAVSETVTGTRDPDLRDLGTDTGTPRDGVPDELEQRAETQRFFERA